MLARHRNRIEIVGEARANVLRESPGLATEKEKVVFSILHLGVRLAHASGKSEKPAGWSASQKISPVWIVVHINVRPVIEPCTFEVAIFQREA